MCPFCLATAAAIAGGSISAAGVVIFAVKKVFTSNDANQILNASPTKEVQNHDNDSHND